MLFQQQKCQFNTLIGGRLFPGGHHHANFQVAEEDETFCIQITRDDDNTRVAVEAHIASHLPEHSIFASLEEASAFFEHGSLEYSVTNKPGTLVGKELSSQLVTQHKQQYPTYRQPG